MSAELRLRAEKQLKKRRTKRFNSAGTDAARFIQELQIQRIELELQNEELRHSKAAAEEALEKYTDLYDFAPTGYFNLAPDGTIHLLNLTGAALVGLERSRLVGRPFGRLLVEADRPGFAEFLRGVFSQSGKVSGNFELLLPDKSVRTVEIEAQRIFHGRECKAVVVDVTAHRQAEEKVRISEIRYRRLFEAAHDGVLLLDPVTCRITDANPFMTTLLGYPHDQLVGKELFEIGLLQDKAASQAMFQGLKKTHEVRYENLPLKAQSGRHQEVEVVANLYDEDGHPVIQCNIRDITARKHAADILRRNEALFSALIEQSPVGVYVVDGAFRMQQINSTAKPAFRGVRRPQGRDFKEVLQILWPEPVAAKIEARFRHTLVTGESFESKDFAARRHDTGATENYEWQLQRVTLPGGELGVVCFFSDVTERKRAERTQRRLDMLTASNGKLKREIVRRLAGETALRASEHRAQLLLGESLQLQSRLRQLAHRMLRVQEDQKRKISRELHDDISQLLVGIVVHLANFTRAAELNPAGIRRTIGPMRRLVEKSVLVVHQFARELRPAMLDDLGLIPALQSYLDDFPQRAGRRIILKAQADVEALDNDKRTVFYRVAQEALTNAAKHAHASLIKVSIRKVPGGWMLEVADNGRAFEVQLLASAKWGNRLGLAGMRERVEMVGGRLTVESIPGTTIRAEIPAGKAPLLPLAARAGRVRRTGSFPW